MVQPQLPVRQHETGPSAFQAKWDGGLDALLDCLEGQGWYLSWGDLRHKMVCCHLQEEEEELPARRLEKMELPAPKQNKGRSGHSWRRAKEAGAISSCREGGAACPSAREGGAACPRAKEGGAACPRAKEGEATAISCKRGRDRCLLQSWKGRGFCRFQCKRGRDHFRLQIHNGRSFHRLQSAGPASTSAAEGSNVDKPPMWKSP
ncbi:UNVERIFIED_CONTAM: hypothetical protein FKN15_008746 [Acipenser sinensis]